jgi:hypothetical protein
MRYFFHLEGEERIVDRRGFDLSDDDAARREAQKICAALRKRKQDQWRVVVTNVAGDAVAEIPVRP